MVGFTEAVGSAVRGAACTILGANSDLQGWWARNTNLPFTTELARGAEGLRRNFCDNPTPVPPQPSSIGGQAQCADTVYEVDYILRQLDDQGNVELQQSGDFFCRGGLRVSNILLIGQLYQEGYSFTNLANETQNFGIPVDRGAGETSDNEITNVRVVSGPDDCGEDAPPDPAQPYPGNPVNIDITYTDNTNVEITEQGDLTLNLPIFLPGSVIIPFNIDLGGFEFNGSIDLSGEVNIEIPPGRQPDDTTTDTEPPALPPGQEPVDPETERRIIGVHVFTQLPANSPVTVISQDDGPSIFAPRGGSVRFLIIGGGGSSWTEDIDIKGDREYIPCPAPQGAISVIANPLPGGTTSLIRVYGSVPDYLIPD